MKLSAYLPKHRIQLFYAAALLGVTIMNLFVLNEEMKRIRSFKKILPHQMIGYQFAGLEQFTKEIKYLGYYTDQNVNDNDDAHKLFAHAQFMLAPSILDLNNTDHEYILFVCSNEKKAWLKIKEINAQPLRRNKYGMILAKRQ